MYTLPLMLKCENFEYKMYIFFSEARARWKKIKQYKTDSDRW